MATAQENPDVNLNHWIPGTRFFSASDGKYFVVDADLTEYPNSGPHTFLRRETVVLYCNPDATTTDLVPDHTFPAGTTPEEAVIQLGYTLDK